MPKNVEGGTLWDLLTYIQLQNMKKTRRGDPSRTLKNFRKKSHSAEKNPKGDPLGTSGCVCFLGKVKNERGTLWTKSPLAGLGLRCSGGFRIVSKKWTDQCEDCSLKKNKPGTAQVGAISKAQKQQKNFQVFSSTVPEKPKR